MWREIIGKAVKVFLVQKYTSFVIMRKKITQRLNESILQKLGTDHVPL